METVTPPAGQITKAKVKLSDILASLEERAREGPFKLGDMLVMFSQQGISLIVLIVCLPFLLPVLPPGLGLVFGLAISFVGLRMSLGLQPWLPLFIRNVPISYEFIRHMAHFTRPTIERLEKFVHPRWHFFSDNAAMIRFHGIHLIVMGILLQSPIPFTNAISAIPIILMTYGMLERDGLMIFIAYVTGAATTAVFIGMYFLGNVGLHWIEGCWRNFFGG